MLIHQIGKDRPEFKFSVGPLSWPVFVEGFEFGYKPNTQDYNRRSTLRIDNGRDWAVQFAAHGIGTKFRGLIGFVAFFVPDTGGPEVASETPFQVNYAEPYESVERRFRVWLERSLARALTLWRQSL
jgi:hypothetical protein